tara:strand:- start:570 stop:1217 length:648 start_codon:yes stop_codon:yes gene_type:complete
MPVKLIDIFNTLDPCKCPFKYNFHCHTTYSDGSLSVKELLLQAIQIGLEHISITDHHTIAAHNELNMIYKDNPNLVNSCPVIWSGIEISCLLNRSLVHVLGYGFSLDSKFMDPYITSMPPVDSYLMAESVVKAIHLSGGYAVLAHPARYRANYKNLIKHANQLGFDGIESWYDYERSQEWRPSPLICDSIDSYSTQLGMFSTCGTDTHGFSLISR